MTPPRTISLLRPGEALDRVVACPRKDRLTPPAGSAGAAMVTCLALPRWAPPVIIGMVLIAARLARKLQGLAIVIAGCVWALYTENPWL